MLTRAEKVLTKGLQAGFAGKSTVRTVSRGAFGTSSADVTLPQSSEHYSDQWIVRRVGGGQEIAGSGDETVTRVYAGGIIAPEKLRALGVNEPQVLAYLKKQLSALSGKTRLHEDVLPPADGDWQYRYAISHTYPDIPLSVGVETIAYKGVDVFVDVFLNAPVA